MKKPSRTNCPTGLTDYFYRSLVPKDPYQNVEFRKWLLDKAWKDPKLAQEIWIMCARDMLFWINCFGWLLEPRDRPQWQPHRWFGSAREIPFITRPYQDDSLLTMQENLGRRDMLALKSREMGATWMVLYLFDHPWRFHGHQHFGVVSKDEDSAANPDDPDSLMNKFDFIDEHMPKFLRPNRSRSRSRATLANLDNGSSITAYACTSNIARGGRKRAFFCDEVHSWPPISDNAAFDSLQHISHCRLMVSTPNRDRGQAGAFYDVCQAQDSSVLKFEWGWWKDPDKAAGMYKSDGNTIQYLDPKYVYPANYKFIRDGKDRSPYFDYECQRAGATEQSIAAELEMNFGGATSRFFTSACISKAQAMTRDPNARFELRKVMGTWLPELIQTERDNPVDVWITPESGLYLNQNGVLTVPVGRMYSIGVDVAAGKGGGFSSCSALCVIDIKTSTQVAEYAYNKIEPEEYAEFGFHLGMIFNRAIMCIEVTGVGARFLSRITQLAYPNLWLRPTSDRSVFATTSGNVGYDNKDGGQKILGEMQNAILKDKFQPRSKAAVAECERYYIDKNGDLKHPLVGAGRADAPEKSHGDRAIAMAAAWYAYHSDPAEAIAEVAEQEVPYGSFQWRRDQYSAKKEQLNPRWWNPLEKQPTKHSSSIY